MSAQAAQGITINSLNRMREQGEKIACLTAYDASFANLLDQAGIDVILVGDSLGMVIQGNNSTVSVTMDDMLYLVALTRNDKRRGRCPSSRSAYSATALRIAVTAS